MSAGHKTISKLKAYFFPTKKMRSFPEISLQVKLWAITRHRETSFCFVLLRVASSRQLAGRHLEFYNKNDHSRTVAKRTIIIIPAEKESPSSRLAAPHVYDHVKRSLRRQPMASRRVIDFFERGTGENRPKTLKRMFKLFCLLERRFFGSGRGLKNNRLLCFCY